MGKRKNICFLTAAPEAIHALRIADGISKQCEKYGYNVMVFSPMVNPAFFIRDYAAGELNIYNLVNFESFDGFIMDIISIVLQQKTELADEICRKIREKTDAPLVGIGMPIEGVTMVNSNNDEMFRELCRHVVNVHGCKKICLLTGQKGNSEAEIRLSVMLDELAKLGALVEPEHIIYGDFWYNSGKKLAQDILSGKIARPEAVIAASDHMALGLIEELKAGGIRVPEDICVVGFEATPEAILNDISLTTIKSNFAKTAADAVDIIRAEIEPSKKIIPFVPDAVDMLHVGVSCGCKPDLQDTLSHFRSSLYFPSHNYATDLFKDNIDIGLLMESYIPEKLTASQTPEECISNIYLTAYILAPYENVSICLREDWLEEELGTEPGYPEKMKLMMYRSKPKEDELRKNDLSNGIDSELFLTSQMLPLLFEDHERPYIYYFSPMHFGNQTLGYTVLQRKLSDNQKMNMVYRNWLRFANNALEMVRSKYRLETVSYYDKMTGLLNRRGMYTEYEKMYDRHSCDDELFACVIDMDGLKYINDTFGHQEGDLCIIAVSRAVKAITEDGEICVRAGGDEFFVIGIGQYDDDRIKRKNKLFHESLESVAERKEKPYMVSASVGFVVKPLAEISQLDNVLMDADEAMYRNKIERKIGRRGKGQP